MKDNHLNKNIILIGMSGVGKSTVGRHIANRLRVKFADTDDIIISKTGETIDCIFKQYGEDYFRNLEKKVIKDISKRKGMVISTGGGVVLDISNIYFLKKCGVIFLLHGSIDTIFDNIRPTMLDNNRRPLLKEGKDLKNRIKELYLEREKLYLTSADYIVNVDKKSTSVIGEEIISIFKNLYSCS